VTNPVITDQIGEILDTAKTIAVVGLSNSPLRPSYGVAAYLQTHGYDIVPVNPTINGALGKKSCPSLAEVTAKVDIVDIFRKPEAVDEVVDQAIARGDVKCIWMQEDVVNERAADKARMAGIFVVMDRCILKEHRRRHH
jgi:predicted CoA-binding protein